MLRALKRRLRMRTPPPGVRLFVLGLVSVLALGSTGEARHTHDSLADFGQCAVSHAIEHRVLTSPTPTIDAPPPIRVVEVEHESPISAVAPRNILPPATGPPATH